MFRKVLIANRGAIAVRIVRACREMGLPTVALYTAADKGSLHVRLADACMLLPSAEAFLDASGILDIAQSVGADAIHPGYGFLAAEPGFTEGCSQLGITFIGPAASTAAQLRDKIGALQRARAAGFPTVTHSPRAYAPGETEALAAAAEELGYPVVVKSTRGGRGYGERLIRRPERLIQAVQRAQAESRAVYGGRTLYLEKAILPAHQIVVPVLGDHSGQVVHLGEREGSVIYRNQKIVEETPAPCLNPTQRAAIWQAAVDLARLFNYTNLGAVEFLVDDAGHFYFTEIKTRIQVPHALTEMATGRDLVQAQIRLAAGAPLDFTQADVTLRGHAMLGAIHAQIPRRNGFLPTPGRLKRVRFPDGMGLRVDSYVQCQADVPAEYESLIAKLMTWGETREACLARFQAALRDVRLSGLPTNLSLLQEIAHTPAFTAGRYTTDLVTGPLASPPQPEGYAMAVAAMAAVLYVRRRQAFAPTRPERFTSGWHRSARTERD